ncbi:MAG: hypothetical protein ACR2H1_04360 [Limisphaerales bacterium]
MSQSKDPPTSNQKSATSESSRPRYSRRPRPSRPPLKKASPSASMKEEESEALADKKNIESVSDFPKTSEREKEIPEKINPDKRGSALARALAEVQEISASLRKTLNDLENVLEILEEAEHQKTMDETEIETLRHALRQLQRPEDREQRPPSFPREPRRQWRERREQPHKHGEQSDSRENESLSGRED